MLDEATTVPLARRRAHHEIASRVGLPAPGAGAIPAAPAMPRRLPVLAEPVAPAAVASAEDRVRCERLRCTMTAGACAGRQKLAHTRKYHRGHKLDRYQIGEAAMAPQFAMCRRCPTGRQIAARLGVRIVESSGNGYVDDRVFGDDAPRARKGRSR
ncbi:hypothetical protein WMF30_10115 [Sorangium sp. So ce134]